MRFFHDAGHGGSNDGTEEGGLLEKDWTRDFALLAHNSYPGFECLQSLSRLHDIPLSLSARAEMARNFGAGLALSHHVNAGPTPALKGLMCFARADDAIGLEVGSVIMAAAPPSLRRKDPTCYIARPTDWTRRTYNVLEPYGSIPAVLIEWGFVTNPGDLGVLQDPEAVPLLLDALHAGLFRFASLSRGS